MNSSNYNQDFIYLHNKYSKWYFNIIDAALKLTDSTTTKLQDYREKHHIFPSALGGTNDLKNKVSLTAREHFICHLLLTKMVEGKSKSKMIFALSLMRISNKWHQRYIPNSRIFAMVKKMIKETTSKSMKDRWENENFRQNMVSKMKQYTSTSEGQKNLSYAAKKSHESRGFDVISKLATQTNNLRWQNKENRKSMSKKMKLKWEERKLNGSFISKKKEKINYLSHDFSGKNNPACVVCKLKSPNGSIFEITEIMKFCKDNNLLYNYLLNTLKTGIPVPNPIKLYKTKSTEQRLNTVGWHLLSKVSLNSSKTSFQELHAA